MTMTGSRWLKSLLANFAPTDHRRQHGSSSGSTPSALDEKLLVDSASLSCPICYITFTETPKVLPCGHSICPTCLKGLSLVASPRDHQCPLCRTYYKLDVLPKNYALESVLDAIVEEVENFYKGNEKTLSLHGLGLLENNVEPGNIDEKSNLTKAVAADTDKEIASTDSDDAHETNIETEIVRTFAQSNLLFDYNRLKRRVESMNHELREIKISEKELRSLKFREMTFRELKDENKALKSTVNSLQLLTMFLVALCAYFLAKSY